MYYDFKVKIPEVKGKIYERPIKGCSKSNQRKHHQCRNCHRYARDCLSGETVFFCEGDKPKSMVQASDSTTGKHLHFREKGLILSVIVKRFTR